MNKPQTQLATKVLESLGFRDIETIKDQGAWTVFATGTDGTRVRFDALEKVHDRLKELEELRRIS